MRKGLRWDWRAWRTVVFWKTQRMTPCQTHTAARPTSAQKSSAAQLHILVKWPTCGVWGSCYTPCWWAGTRSMTRTQPHCSLRSGVASAVCPRACLLKPSVCCRVCCGGSPQRDWPHMSCSLIPGSTSRHHYRKCCRQNRKWAQPSRLCHLLTWRETVICSVNGLPDWGTYQGSVVFTMALFRSPSVYCCM